MFPENFLSFQAFFLFRKIFSLSDASDKFSFFRAFFLFQKTFLSRKPYFSVFNLSLRCFRRVFLSLPSFLPFQKSFLSLSDAFDKFSLFEPSSFQKVLSFRILPDPPSLFSSSFSLSLGLISLSIPFGTFRLLGAFKSGHFSWRDEQVKRERGGDRHVFCRQGWSGEKITPTCRHRLPPGRNPDLR